MDITKAEGDRPFSAFFTPDEPFRRLVRFAPNSKRKVLAERLKFLDDLFQRLRHSLSLDWTKKIHLTIYSAGETITAWFYTGRGPNLFHLELKWEEAKGEWEVDYYVFINHIDYGSYNPPRVWLSEEKILESWLVGIVSHFGGKMGRQKLEEYKSA